jgi:hypothetical protein
MSDCPEAQAALKAGDAAKAADAFKKCAGDAFERGDLRGAVDLFRAALAYGAKVLHAAEVSDDLYKRSERERNDRLKPGSSTRTDREEPVEPHGIDDPTVVNVGAEEKAAEKAEHEARGLFDDPVAQAKKWLEAASHHRNIAKHEHRVNEDPCAEAEALAAACDDYVHAAEDELAAGNPEAAYRMMLEAASLAEEAARCYEECAEAKDKAGQREQAIVAWSKADTCWERVWLFWDRMRRYWTSIYARGWDDDDTQTMDEGRRGRDNASRKEAEAAKQAEKAREHLPK